MKRQFKPDWMRSKPSVRLLLPERCKRLRYLALRFCNKNERKIRLPDLLSQRQLVFARDCRDQSVFATTSSWTQEKRARQCWEHAVTARALTEEAEKQAEEAANASHEPANAVPGLLAQPIDIEVQKMLAGVFSGVAIGFAYGWQRYQSPLGCAGAAAVGGLTAAATGGGMYLSNQYAHTSTTSSCLLMCGS
jgi:hypothetical protein